MESKKVCRFLIAIFLFLTLLFYYLYSSEMKKRFVVSDELVADAVMNIKSYGVSIDESLIERKTPERDIYYFEIEDKNKYFEAISGSICKNLFDSDIETTEFDTPDGFSVGIYSKTGSERELGRIIFSQPGLSFVFSKNGLGMQDGEEPIENMQTEEITDVIAAVIKETVEDMTSGSKLGYRISGSSSNDMFLIVSVIQTVDGSDISNSFMNFVFREEELVIITGNWITETPKAKYHNTLLDGVNVLYKLDLENVKSIESQEVVYNFKYTDDNKYFMIPCWKIKYFDKNDKLVTSFFDAL